MAGSLVPFSRQFGKSFFQKFVGDFIEQAFVDEANDRMGTNVNTAPTPGGGVATVLRKAFKSGSDTGSSSRTSTSGPLFTPGSTVPRPLFPVSPYPQPQSGGEIEKTAGKFGEFYKNKSKIYKFYQFDNKKKSVKDELFAVMASSIVWYCNLVGRSHEIPQRLTALREYVDGLTEDEAARELGVWTERRNRDNIPGI